MAEQKKSVSLRDDPLWQKVMSNPAFAPPSHAVEKYMAEMPDLHAAVTGGTEGDAAELNQQLAPQPGLEGPPPPMPQDAPQPPGAPIPQQPPETLTPEQVAQMNTQQPELGTLAGAQKIATDNANEALTNNKTIYDRQSQTLKAESELDAKQHAEVQAPIDEQNAKFLQGQVDGLQKFQADNDAHMEAQMASYQQVNNEMHNLAVQKPQDIYGQAGVNKAMGAIAIFLGGAGTNGAHENRALTMIQGMAQANAQRDERNYQHLQAVGENDKSIYGMMRNRGLDKTQATLTLNNMYLSAHDALAKSMASRYAGQRSQIALQKALTQSAAIRANNDHAVKQEAVNNSLKISQQAGVVAAANATNQLKLGRQAETDALYGVRGFKGRTTKEEHGKLVQIQTGARGISDELSRLKTVLQDSKDPEVARSRMIGICQAIIKGHAKKFFDTGQRLEGPEITQMETISTNAAEDLLKIITGPDVDVFSLGTKIDAARREVEHSAYVTLSGTKTLEYDKDDPYWKDIDPTQPPDLGESIDGSVSQVARAKLKALKGGERVDAAPAVDSGVTYD